jgi:hypothetical protein
MTPLSGKHQRTLEQIFVSPPSGTIRYEDVKSLLKFLGTNFSEKGKTSGSRICVTVRGRKLLLHKPHPGNELDKGAVKSLKRALEELGIIP